MYAIRSYYALAALDRKITETYAKAMQAWPADEKAKQRALQRGWVKGRNDCWKAGDVLVGRLEGRTSDQDITLFKSLGIAIEDLAAAHHIWTRARVEKRGSALAFGGLRDPRAGVRA